MKKCPACGLYLIKDVVSDLDGVSGNAASAAQHNNRHSQARRRTIVGRADDASLNEHRDSASDSLDSGRAGGFQRGRDVQGRNGSATDSPAAVHRRSTFHLFLRRILPIARIVFPGLLILTGIFIVIANWSTIRAVLACLITGAIIGGGLMVFLSLRRGSVFNQNGLATSAVMGAAVTCILQYNILGVGTEISEIISAFLPVFIIIGGIWLMFRR